jgi:hypothetical protein
MSPCQRERAAGDVSRPTPKGAQGIWEEAGMESGLAAVKG